MNDPVNGINEIKSKSLSSSYSQTRLLITLVVGIFFAEVLAMIVIFFVAPLPYWAETLLDATIMILLIAPLLYYFHFRPLNAEMKERNRSEKLLVNVLENLSVGVWIVDHEGAILHGNPASQKIWAGAKYGGKERYGEYKAWWLDSGKPVEPGDWAAVRALRNGEAILEEELEIECFDGSRKVILNSAIPIYEGEAVQGAIVVNQDISERKRAEKELEKSEALFKTSFQILPVGAWLTDENGKITYGNPAAREIWAGAKYVGTEQFGEYKAWWLDSGKPLGTDDWAITRAIKNGETSLNEELEIECFDGSHKIILNSAIPIRDEQGQLHGIFVVNQDITQRKQFEQALIQSNELIQKAFDSVDVLIAYMDRQFNFIQVNEAYARNGGHPVDFFPGKNHFGLFPHAENQAIFQRVVESGEAYSVMEKPFEYPEFPERGITYWNWRLQPVLAIDGTVQWVVLSLVDVTERKRAELLLERQNQELQELSIAEGKQRRLAETLNEVGQALSKTLDFERVMNTLLDYVFQQVPADRAYIVVAEGETNLSLLTRRGYENEPGPMRALDTANDLFERPYLQQVISTHQTLLIPDSLVYQGWNNLLSNEAIRSWLGIPINAGDKAIGILALAKTTPNFFTAEHIWLSEAIVSLASVAIQNAWLFEQVRAGHERLQTLSRSLVDVQENERRYIAQELHDEASQSLTALMFGLRFMEQEARNPALLLPRLEELKKLTDGVMEELHRLAMGLRPTSLDYLGLVVALEQLVKDIEKRYNLTVHFKAAKTIAEMRLPEHIEANIYRITQEALTNTIRHAQARNIDVILEFCEGKIIIMVEDDGIGFDPAQPLKSGHLGLIGMQERAQMISGSLHIESVPGSRTTVVLEVPYDDTYHHR